MELLSCKDVSLGYEGQTVVEHLNFSISQGDYLCIIGENGSGKSTLMKGLLGLKSPVAGKIELKEGIRHKDIGYLPQQSIIQRDFPASVYEIVMSGFLNNIGLRPLYNKKEKNTALEIMNKLSILDLKNRCYRELSGGQQQRVLLARALCATKRLLLLDEPVAGLDPKVTNEMYELIAGLNREGITIIMVSHDIQAAIKYATKILHVCSSPEFYETKQAYLESDTGKIFNLGVEENR